ncbi:MAG TPA: twin-arginine translocation signal domain-containing protein, partial [Thermoanaerobaculia bacterium]|nr:twin-arginine translocation signal domain-containing protein [Thermoanaerobaculia bacterium]
MFRSDRREFLTKLAAAAAGVAVAPALEAQVIQRRTWPPLRQRTRIKWDLHGESFPLFRPGQTATASERITKLEFFVPLFGAERKGLVNPKLPKVINARTIRFDEPGEYYLRVNGGAGYLKAVVFAPDEGIPASLIRLFDFCVVNNLYLGAEDNVWYYRRADYLTEFFTAEQPMMLSCGPTHGVFRWLVRERFCLPARIMTAPGTYYHNGEVARLSHNVPEIYIPDYDKYVFMDLNFGMVPLWLDALELAEVAHATWGDTATDAESLEDLNV